MSVLKTLTINGTTYNVTPIVPASSVTLLASAWTGEGDLHSQVVEIPGVTPRTKVDLQPTAEQLEEFYYKILAFSAENDEGVVTVYAIGDRPLGDHTIQITLTEVEGEGKIRGNTVGTPAPRSDWNQTDPRKADYIANKPDIPKLQEQIEEAEAIAKGRATGYVFDTVDDLDAWLSDAANTEKLLLGDNLYIRATDVPDYWWDGEQKQRLETQKVNLDEYVKNTDYATSTKGGAVVVGEGLTIFSNGKLCVFKAKDTDIDEKVANYRPIVPANLDYAVKTSVTTNTIELTDEEKANACSWMGAVKEQHPTFSDDSIRGYAYCINPSGEQVLLPTTIVATANTIALRNPAGNFYVSTPVLQYECTNKGYVDNLIAGLTATISIPEYIREAAKAVARKVNNRQTEASFTFAVFSDGHIGWGADATNEAVRQAMQAVKVINSRCPIDLIAHAGDLSLGNSYSTVESTFDNVEDYTEIMDDISFVPSLWLAGNHDDAPYQDTDNRLTQKQIFALFGRKNLQSGAVFNAGYNYGYLDLERRKVRIVYLDTHDKRSWGSSSAVGESQSAFMDASNISGDQLSFLANEVLDFSDKTDVGEWNVIVLSHTALNEMGTYTDPDSGTVYDYNTSNAATILNQYKKGGSGSITHNGVVVPYDFSTIEKRANIVCCVHGHNHAYVEEIIGTIHSIGCPNIMNGRERVSADGNTYTKTAGTAEGTSFCIITVDTQNKRIYADHYGAGYDREWEYSAEVSSYTNLIPLATGVDGSIYNGVGYKTQARLNSSGLPTDADGMDITGFIPCSADDIIRLQGIHFNKNSVNINSHRIAFYDSNKEYVSNTLVQGTNVDNLGAVWNEGGDLIQFTVNGYYGGNSDAYAYFRICGDTFDDAPIITVNEEIE